MYSERDENGNVIEPSEGIIQEEVVAHFVEKKLLTDEAWVNTFLTNSRTDKILRGINTLLQRGLGGKEARFLASVRSKWLNALEEERGEQTAPRAEAVAAAKERRQAKGQRKDSRTLRQLDIVKHVNPSLLEDLKNPKSFEEAWENPVTAPDFNRDGARDAMERGYVSVYGRNDIKQGAFVSVSEDYLRHVGGAKPRYSTVVPLDDILWIDSLSGIYASEEEGIPISPGEYVRVNDPILAAISRATREGFEDGEGIVVYNGGYNYYCTVNSVEGFIYKIERKESRTINLVDLLIKMGVDKNGIDEITGRNGSGIKAAGSLRSGNPGRTSKLGGRRSAKGNAGMAQRTVSSDKSGSGAKDISNERHSQVRRAKGSRDEEYLSAVERGDMETAQRLVDEAAEKAMAYSKARNKNGNLLPLYHYTDNEFTTFDLKRSGSNQGKTHGEGIYLSSHPTEFAYAGKRRMRLYADIRNPFEMQLNDREAEYILNKFASTKHNLDKHNGLHRNHAMSKLMSPTRVFDYLQEYADDNNITTIDILYELGYDGVHNGMEWVAFFPKQIKSADPVTYDDNGKVIPLSERFNPEENDIRYAKGTRQYRKGYNAAKREQDKTDHATMREFDKQYKCVAHISA